MSEIFKRQTYISIEFRDIVRVKINSVKYKNYIRINDKVMSFTNFFPVAKTMEKKDDVEIIGEIWMVYDATKSGLNDAVLAP